MNQLLTWFKALFFPQPKKLLTGIRWDQATPEERFASMQYMDAYFQATGCCPDCQIGRLLLGPKGGCSVNVQCSYCDNWFNACYGLGTHYEVGLTDRIRLTEGKRAKLAFVSL